MATQISIGFSHNTDTEKAAQDAAFAAKSHLATDKIDVVLVLSTIHYDPYVALPIIHKILPKTKIIGCSTAGIILSDSIETRGLAILAISSEDAQFGVGSVENINAQYAHQSGTVLARNSLNDFGKHGRQIFIFFVDGKLENISLLLKSVQDVLGNVFPIVGAGSCDDFHFQKAYQFFQNRVHKNAAVGLIMGGHMNVGVAGRHGWRPLGKPRIVDKASGNIIKTIDGKPAANLYEEYLGDEAQKLRSNQFGQMDILYPLGIYVEESKEYLLRNAIDIHKDGSIVCQGEVPEGSQVHIMIGNKDSCKDAAFEAAKEAHKGLLGKKPKLVFIIESMARLKLLGRMAIKEITKIKEIFGSNVPIIGMYSNGEIYPLATGERLKTPHFQNESIVICAIS